MTMDIQHLGNLARIEIAPEDEAAIAAKVESVLGYVAELSNIDTDMYTHAVAPKHRNVLRKDEVGGPEWTERQAILKNAPQKEGDLFKVQKMIG